MNLAAVVLVLLAVASVHLGGEWLVSGRLPAWVKLGVLLAVFAVVLASAWYGHDRRRAIARRQLSRLNHGLCPECGYDLRASPERCPECGARNWCLGRVA